MKGMPKNMGQVALYAVTVLFIVFGSIGGCGGDGGGGGGGNPAFNAADFVRGGLLWDKWWKANGADEPDTNPLYPADQNAMFRDPPRDGSQTWRCKECHGWDYLGDEGFYGPGSSHFTGIEGVIGVADSLMTRAEGDHTPEELFDIIKFGIPGEMSAFEGKLDDEDIWDLVKFLREGLIDNRTLVDYDSPDMNEPIAPFDLDNGENLYNGGCADCHGIDGEGLAQFGTDGFGGLNALALGNPVETMHKMRVGQPGTFMPSSIDMGWSLQDDLDVLAYMQEVLPFPDMGPEPTPGPTPEPTPPPMMLDGELLYMVNCESCHGVDGIGGFAGDVVGKSGAEIDTAIASIGAMMNPDLEALTIEEVDAIADFLAP